MVTGQFLNASEELRRVDPAGFELNEQGRLIQAGGDFSQWQVGARAEAIRDEGIVEVHKDFAEIEHDDFWSGRHDGAKHDERAGRWPVSISRTLDQAWWNRFQPGPSAPVLWVNCEKLIGPP